jgi:PAS domain S-box-containing protein
MVILNDRSIPGVTIRGSRHPIIYGLAVLLLLLVGLASLQIGRKEGGLFPALHLSSIDDLKALKSGTPVRLRGVVTYSDLESHRIYLQDSTGALMVRIPGTLKVQPGEKAELEGSTIGDYSEKIGLAGPSIANPKIKILGSSKLPAPESLLLTDFLIGKQGASRVKVDGVVQSAHLQGDDLFVELAADGQRLPVTIRDAQSADPGSLVDARVSFRGVGELLYGPDHQIIGTHLWVSDLRDLTIDDQPPAHPPLIPTLHEMIENDAWRASGHRIRIQGKVVWQNPGEVVQISDNTAVIPVETAQTAVFTVGETVEALGWSGMHNYETVLEDSVVRRLAPSEIQTKKQPPLGLPSITSVARIRALSPEDAKHAYPVKIRGVITYQNPRLKVYFIQDESAGIFFGVWDDEYDLKLGQEVLLEGVTAPGQFAPIITNSSIRVLGEGHLPPDKEISPDTAASGNEDSQWVVLEGVVHPMQYADGVYNFNFMTNIGSIRTGIVMPQRVHLESLIDARVRIRGVFATIFNQYRQLSAYRLAVGSLDLVRILQAAPPDPFSTPAGPIKDLLHYSGKSSFTHRARVEGTVTLRREGLLYIEDKTGGLEIQENDATARIGDLVDAVGYAVPGDYSPLLLEAVVRRLGQGAPSVPPLISAEEALAGKFNNRLVQIDARLMDSVNRSTHQTLILQADQLSFNALLDHGARAPFRDLRQGSTVRLTGICSAQAETSDTVGVGRVPVSFRIFLRSPEDIAVIHQAPWWNLRNTLAALGFTIVAICLALAWIVGLRRRVNAQTADLLAQTAELNSLIDNNPVAIVTLNLNHLVRMCNPAFEKLFGHRQKEILNQSLLELVSGNEFRSEAEAARSENAQGKTVHTVTQRYRSDGSLVDVEVFAVPLRVAGKAVGTLVLYQDITERKRAEEVLRNAKEDAEEASRAKSEFLANMSHEIRTPMNGIMGMTELVLDTDLNPEQRTYLNLAKASSDSLLALINDILDYSKIEAGKLEIDAIDFNLGDSLGDTMKTMGLRAHQKQLELAFQIDPDVPGALVGDPGRLRQIIVNLVGNAIKFTERGEVVVYVKTESRTEDDIQLHFTIADTGIGIPIDKQTAIFEAFQQADGSMTRKYGGTGLGLTISSRLVELMKGRIWVESEPGQGSRFHFITTFALQKAPFTTVVPKDPTTLRDMRVLIVDDNATNRQILQKMLENWQMTPTAVDSAANAIIALAEAKGMGESYSLILLDAQMPETDGFALAESIKRNPDWSGASIMMHSSSGQRGDAARCRELGVSAYLTKPIRQGEMLDAILTALGSRPQDKSPAELVTRHSLRENRYRLHILLAEDNAVNQLVALRLLEKHGHTVLVAANGKKALEALENEGFDLILMDVQMPEMNGLEATLTIREKEKTTGKHIPIVAMTAHAMKGDEERFLASGMDSYLTKPFRTEKLLSLLDEVGRRKVNPEQALILPRDRPVMAEIDLNGALERLNGDRDLFEELTQVFKGDCPRIVEGMRHAIVSHDAKKLEYFAHALNGSSATLGAVAVSRLASEIEHLAHSEDAKGASERFKILELEVEKMFYELESLARDEGRASRAVIPPHEQKEELK